MLDEAGLVDGSHVIMEKPFGTDLESAVALNAELHEVFAEEPDLPDRPFPRQGAGAEHPRLPLRQRPVRADLEPQLHRPRADRRSRDARTRQPRRLLRADRRLSRHGRHPPLPDPRLHGDGAADRARARADQRGEEQGVPLAAPIDPADVVRGQFIGYREEKGVDPESDTETFVALKCRDRQLALGGRPVLPAHRQAAWRRASGSSRSPSASRRKQHVSRRIRASARQGPDHLTFDLADPSKMSLSFYGKRPGPGMRLDKLSLQFALHETGLAGDVLEAYERLILDAMRGDHTLFMHRRRHRTAVGGFDAAARQPAAGAHLRAGLLGAAVDPPTDRAPRLAAAVRARLARPQLPRRLSHFRQSAPRAKR